MRNIAFVLLVASVACGGRMLDDTADEDAADTHDAHAPDVSNVPVDGGLVLDAGTSAASSCADVLANGNTTSGLYGIVQDGQTLQVYCDMTIAGGGFTAFFSSTVGDAFAHFESGDACPAPATHCLRHIPSSLASSTLFAVSCGSDAVVFHANLSTTAFFGGGVQHAWQPLSDVAAGAGNPNLAFATKIWTGSGTNQGWIVSNDDNEPSFTPHTFASAYDFNQTWNYCNGTPSTTATVRLLFR